MNSCAPQYPRGRGGSGSAACAIESARLRLGWPPIAGGREDQNQHSNLERLGFKLKPGAGASYPVTLRQSFERLGGRVRPGAVIVKLVLLVGEVASRVVH